LKLEGGDSDQYTGIVRSRRRVFGEKMLDLAHIIFGALVVGQFLAERPFSWGLFAAGIGALLIFYLVSYYLLGEG